MKNKSRRRFLFAGLSLAAVIAFFKSKPAPEEKVPLKFLTQDGRLVYVDTDKLPVSTRTASKEDVQTWIKNKDHGRSKK